ncbi:MAG: Rieske 2Fe-2S domain-containing protein [Acidimicrobiaceae bacterium]|nr:Rieske 2Fe-2S domain-containing protein [Acidimicrobiaceae bacterium]
MPPKPLMGEVIQKHDSIGNNLQISQLIVDEGQRFRLNSSVYTDEQLFDLEMTRIFGHSWLFVAHEEMVPQPGNYATSIICQQPVIISRDENYQLHVLFNRCAHRGSVVCREERGHANVFRCPYHGWIFSNNGRLVGAAQRNGYPDDFLEWGLKLEPVPRVEIYRGLIFANLDPNAIPLAERLRFIRGYIDLWCDRSPNGRITLPEGTHRYEFPANWKFQAENGVDGYHGNYVHESFVNLLERSGERSAYDTTQARDAVGSRNFAKGLPFGDGLLERKDGMLGTFDYRNQSSYCQQIEEAYGPERADDIMMQRNIFIFPNLFLFESHIRVIQPTRANKTFIDVYPTYLAGADTEINEARLYEHERFFGPSGFGAPDDIEIFVCSQTGAAANGWLEFSRGMHRETVNELGETIGHSTDEIPQRSLYREWRRLMAEDHSSGGDD